MRRSPRVALFVAVAGAIFAAPLSAFADPPRACFDAAEQGQSLRDQAKLGDARDAFRMCAAPTCPALVQRDCAQWLQDVEARMPSIIVTASDPSGHELIDVRVLVDGKMFATRLDGVSKPIDPGVHIFRFEFPGSAPVEQQLVVRDGEKYQKLHVDLQPPSVPVVPPPDDSRPHGNRAFKTAAFISAGVGVVALGSFAYFGISGVSDNTHDTNTCAPRCSETETNSVHRELLIADISLGVTVVAAALATFFYLESRPKMQTAAALVKPQPPLQFTTAGFRF